MTTIGALWMLASFALGTVVGRALKALAFVPALLLLASTAHAGPLRAASWATLVGGNAADIRTTYVNLPMGGGHCVEGNSGIYGTSPSVGRLIVGKLIFAAPVGALSVVLDRQGKHTAANVFRFIGGGIGASAAVYNVRQVCR